MAQIQVRMQAPAFEEVLPGDFTLEAIFTNTGSEPARLNLAHASHPSLVLEVRDSQDSPVLLPPPSVPSKEELEAGQAIAPQQTVKVAYAGLLDMNLAPGVYRVRYAATEPALGGSGKEALVSDWLEFTVRKAVDVAPTAAPLKTLDATGRMLSHRPFFLLDWIRDLLHWLKCLIRRLLGRRCERVLTRDVDEQLTETISNAPAGAEAWNGTYSWQSRFHLSLDQASCRITVTLRVRLNGTISQDQRNAWEQAIENAWSNRFKLCCRCCCCRDGYTVVTDIQFVASGEHQVVNVAGSTTSMGSWGRDDTTDIGHEFGHMLGALDEYFTVNGVDYGAARQADANIMNNPANGPAAHHFDLIRATVQDLLGTRCRAIAVDQRC